jgi:phosphotriesterase-related protein
MHIRTVLGNIAPEELGITLGHEHLLIDLRGLWDNPPTEWAYLIDQEPTLQNRGELMRNAYASRPNLLIDNPELCTRELKFYHAGVSQQELDVMLIETPKRLLTFSE